MYISQTAVVLANIWENMVDQYVVVVPPKHTHIRMSRLWQMWREWGSFACWRCAWTGSPTMYGACSYRNANTHTHTHRVNTTLRHTRCKNLSSGVAKHLSLLPDLGFLSSFRLSGSFAVRFFFFPFFLPSISVLNIRTNFCFLCCYWKMCIFFIAFSLQSYFLFLYLYGHVCDVRWSIRFDYMGALVGCRWNFLPSRHENSILLFCNTQNSRKLVLHFKILYNRMTRRCTLHWESTCAVCKRRKSSRYNHYNIPHMHIIHSIYVQKHDDE